MWVFYILSLFCLVEWSSSQRCPIQYKRFSAQHTFCIPRNPTCDIKRFGVSQKDIEDILRFHNEYRSGVALGNENRAIGGSLPPAADMLQMVWDDQLAAVAQKWAENCDFNHDCNDCRAVENFAVGQNLVLQRSTCQGYGCSEEMQIQPNWQLAIKGLYEEVLDYNKNWLSYFEDHDGPMTGHFTQLIWSRSWRVGCGFTAFKEGSVYKKFYVCNYGPAGNTGMLPVYKKGEPCSACPINSCCGSSCGGGLSYPGLCKIWDSNSAPQYRRAPNLFFCGASFNDEDCQASVTGVNRWDNIQSVGGNYDSILLNGGESSTVTFNRPIVPTQDTFCLVIKYQKGPLDASRWDQSSFTANFKMDSSSASPMTIRSPNKGFTNLRIDLQWGSKTKLALTFSVPRGAGRHILDIREISAYDGPCSSLEN